jgi:cyclopropane fatty-acyl-phospholipid synthase-like methyltransferase
MVTMRASGPVSHVRRQTLNAFDDFGPLNGYQLGKLILRALRSPAAQVALAAFGAQQQPRATQAEVALWVLSLIFPAFCLRGTAKLLYIKYCGQTTTAGLTHSQFDYSGES